jgi:signal transduction histidine kinase/ligand-binding sensor domain-containing protein
MHVIAVPIRSCLMHLSAYVRLPAKAGLFAGLLLYFCGVAVAQKPPLWPLLVDTTFAHLGLEQGLPQQVVTAITQDGDGFLWFGTQDGLARWDGYRFRVFRNTLADQNALPSNRDRHGDIWVGMLDGTLLRYQRKSDQLQTISTRVRGVIGSISEDGAGGIWVAAESGLWRLAYNGRLIEHLQHRANEISSLPDNIVRTSFISRDGWLWVATEKGVVRRAPGVTGNAGFQPVLLSASSTPVVYCIYQDSMNRMWFGTQRHGAFMAEANAIEANSVPLAGETKYGKFYVSSFVETRHGQLWVGTYGNGVVELDMQHPQAGGTHIFHDQAISASLLNNTVWSMWRDQSGIMWVATSHGVSSHDPGQKAVSTLFSSVGRTDRLSAGDVYSVNVLPDGRIWLGLGQEGIEILSPGSAQVQRVRAEPFNPEYALPNGQIGSIVADSKGVVYIGSKRGLYRTDLSAKKIERVVIPGREPNKSMMHLLFKGDKLIAGGTDGLWEIDINHLARSRRLQVNLTDFDIQVLCLAPDGGLWVGVKNGLNRIDPDGVRVEHILPELWNSGGLTSGLISSLFIDQQARLWVGTSGGGLHVMLAPGQPGDAPASAKVSGNASATAAGRARFRRIGIEHGLPSTNVNAILQDLAGNIWVSTDDGLARINRKDFSVKPMKRADGVAIRTYWINSAARTRGGELLFGGDSGLTLVQPEYFSEWNYQPPVVLSEVRMMGHIVPVNHINSEQTGQAALVVPPNANSFSAEFSALDFSASERNRYAYRLDAWDAGWIETDANRRIANYANLPPGRYNLRLRGSNRNGQWSSKEMVVPIQVLPFWYQHWWWRVCWVVLAGIALLMLIQLRTRVLRQRQQALQQIVEQRTRQLEAQQELVLITNVELHDSNDALNQANADLETSHQELQQSNAQLETALKHLRETQVQLVQQAKIASLGTLTAGVAHEINNPANFAFVGAYNLGEQLQDFQRYLWILAGPEAPPELIASLQQRFDKLQESLASVSEGTGRIRDLVKDLRTFSRLDEADWKAVRIADSLQATVNLVCTQYVDKVDIRLDLIDNPELECWPAQLNQVFMHLIVNACQAIQSRPREQQQARPGSLIIRSFVEPGFLVLEFEDNGIGIAPSCIEHIFDPFFTTRSVGEGMGMGLSISHGIIKKHGGEIKVRSQIGEGSCFCIHLPLQHRDQEA